MNNMSNGVISRGIKAPMIKEGDEFTVCILVFQNNLLLVVLSGSWWLRHRPKKILHQFICAVVLKETVYIMKLSHHYNP